MNATRARMLQLSNKKSNHQACKYILTGIKAIKTECKIFSINPMIYN